MIENKFSDNDFTQRSLIDTWLIELYLNEINNADDSLSSKNLSDNLKELLKLKEKYLDKVTICNLEYCVSITSTLWKSGRIPLLCRD